MKDYFQIKKVLTEVGINYGVKRIYIFGSYAKGTADENSDLDLLIEKGKPLSLLSLSGIRQDVQDALGLPVDIVTTAGIDESFRKEIEGTERLVYEG